MLFGGTQEAMWVDRAHTEFDVNLEYEYFPFDNQLLAPGLRAISQTLGNESELLAMAMGQY